MARLGEFSAIPIMNATIFSVSSCSGCFNTWSVRSFNLLISFSLIKFVTPSFNSWYICAWSSAETGIVWHIKIIDSKSFCKATFPETLLYASLSVYRNKIKLSYKHFLITHCQKLFREDQNPKRRRMASPRQLKRKILIQGIGQAKNKARMDPSVWSCLRCAIGDWLELWSPRKQLWEWKMSNNLLEIQNLNASDLFWGVSEYTETMWWLFLGFDWSCIILSFCLSLCLHNDKICGIYQWRVSKLRGKIWI